jgi:UDP-glucuronate 4-epimerase
MKILVTGAAGFIGSNLVEALIAAGHEVCGIDNLNAYYDRNIKEKNIQGLAGKFVFKELDLCQADLEKELPSGIEVVYHLSAQPGISSKVAFSEYLNNNVVATYNLVEWAKKQSLHLFVNVSTSSVYGKFATGDELSAPQPISWYGVTKLAAEQLALAAYRGSGLPVTSVRPFSVYGERERPEKMFPKLIDAAFTGKSFPLYKGSEVHKRSFTYVGDVVDGLVRMIAHKDVVTGEIFNFGSPDVVVVGDCIRLVEKITGKKINLEIIDPRPGDQQETSAQIAKAEKLIGYRAKTALEEGVRRQVEWYVRMNK